MDKIECQYLAGDYIIRCNAGDGLNLPTNFQLDEYCLTSAHRVCPLFLKMAEKNYPEVKKYVIQT